MSVRIAPERLSFGDAAVLAQLAHGQVLDDALLDVLEAGVVGVEHLARVHRVEPLLGALAPTAPPAASRGRCGSSTTRPTLAHRLEAARARARPARATASGMPASSIFVRYSSTTDPSSSPSSLRIESICLRRTYSRCCFCAPDSTSSRMRRRTCSSASRSRCSSSASSSRSTTSTVSSSSTRCAKLMSGAYAQCRRARRRSVIARRNAEMRSSASRSSRISSTTARYSRSSSRVLTGGGLLVRPLVGLHAQPPSGVGARGADHGAVQSVQGDGAAAAAAGARALRRRRRGRRSRTRPRGFGTRSTWSSSPTSTVRVTLMPGNTTVSSSGTSSSSVKAVSLSIRS